MGQTNKESDHHLAVLLTSQLEWPPSFLPPYLSTCPSACWKVNNHQKRYSLKEESGQNDRRDNGTCLFLSSFPNAPPPHVFPPFSCLRLPLHFPSLRFPSRTSFLFSDCTEREREKRQGEWKEEKKKEESQRCVRERHRKKDTERASLNSKSLLPPFTRTNKHTQTPSLSERNPSPLRKEIGEEVVSPLSRFRPLPLFLLRVERRLHTGVLLLHVCRRLGVDRAGEGSQLEQVLGPLFVHIGPGPNRALTRCGNFRGNGGLLVWLDVESHDHSEGDVGLQMAVEQPHTWVVCTETDHCPRSLPEGHGVLVHGFLEVLEFFVLLLVVLTAPIQRQIQTGETEWVLADFYSKVRNVGPFMGKVAKFSVLGWTGVQLLGHHETGGLIDRAPLEVGKIDHTEVPSVHMHDVLSRGKVVDH
mmetsp:Transcript_3826/g.7878  ORF Transcript_3826/g.7878 Transcript_3826/m.7878 type:complete len:416 (-) Transcript_3826:1470-2717(-)